jgi:hypothetical protein
MGPWRGGAQLLQGRGDAARRCLLGAAARWGRHAESTRERV